MPVTAATPKVGFSCSKDRFEVNQTFPSRQALHLTSITSQINTCCGSGEEMVYR
jgi:hypothetical protein